MLWYAFYDGAVHFIFWAFFLLIFFSNLDFIMIFVRQYSNAWLTCYTDLHSKYSIVQYDFDSGELDRFYEFHLLHESLKYFCYKLFLNIDKRIHSWFLIYNVQYLHDDLWENTLCW